jgi:hypoxanthine phosphoribosyltransferase
MKITIPYKPRPLQEEIHRNLKRFNVLVCHRRFGKSVLTVNELIKKCLQNKLPRPRYYYISPTYSMSKRIAWDYLKYYTSVLPKMEYHETELRADLPNGGRIQLLGCERPQTLKGLYMDGVILDEVAQMPPKLWTEIIRPALSDRKGFMIAIGTPQGHNSFFDLYNHGVQDETWYARSFKASETKVVDAEELEQAKKLMPPEIYEAEYECSFESSAIGSIYSQSLAKADDEGRVTKVPYDSTIKVDTYWDLGMRDKTAIWFVQQKGSAIHLIDYFEDSGESLEYYASILNERGYVYDTHYLPHDANVREIGTGKSRLEIAQSLGLVTSIVPKMSIEDGINATRMTLGRCWFDYEKTKEGLDALRQYRWAVTEKGETKNRPLHDWTSHAADSFRYVCIGLQETKNWTARIKYPKLGIV